ncbi:MAG: hypothetical protein CME32_29475 [Gimesia sp.]|nr:hypothetical protein [Gimesia sp.]|tara:strand:- start:712 stop:1131 length:420 start_codon:yes stop_codon:yes gene_type:complete
MKKRKSLKSKMAYRIKRSRGSVFLLGDFSDLAGRDQVLRALRMLIAEGLIVKIGYGLYARAKISKISGRLLPEKSLPELGQESLRKLKVKTKASSSELDYMRGLSTQVPTGRVIGVVRSRVSRKIGYNGVCISYERVAG